MRNLKILIITGFFILNSILIIDISSEKATASVIPIINLTFHPGEEEQIAYVGPDDDGIVEFHGSASLDAAFSSDNQTVKLFLNGSTDMGWPVTFESDIIQLYSLEEVPFTAKVMVPLRTSYFVSSNLHITGHANIDNETVTPYVSDIEGVIRIAQFYEFNVTSPELIKNVEPGDNVEFRMDITNTGNGRDTISFFIGNIEELASSGFNIVLGTHVIQVDEGQTASVIMTVYTPENMKHDIYNIKIKSSSEQQYAIEGEYDDILITFKVTSGGSSGKVGQQSSFTNPFMVIGIIIIIIVIIVFVVLKKYNK